VQEQLHEAVQLLCWHFLDDGNGPLLDACAITPACSKKRIQLVQLG
jgi:hypothetical protein